MGSSSSAVRTARLGEVGTGGAHLRRPTTLTASTRSWPTSACRRPRRRRYGSVGRSLRPPLPRPQSRSPRREQGAPWPAADPYLATAWRCWPSGSRSSGSIVRRERGPVSGSSRRAASRRSGPLRCVPPRTGPIWQDCWRFGHRICSWSWKAPLDVLLRRLDDRPSQHSRTQRLAADRRGAERFEHGRLLLDRLVDTVSCGRITVSSDGSVPVEELGGTPPSGCSGPCRPGVLPRNDPEHASATWGGGA